MTIMVVIMDIVLCSEVLEDIAQNSFRKKFDHLIQQNTL